MRALLKLLGVGALCAGMAAVAASSPGAPQPVVTGTVHQALFAIDFDGSFGIAVGAGGEVQESNDSGAGWKTVTPAPTPLALLGVGVSGQQALAVGQTGLVLRRETDGKWQSVDSGTRNRLFAVNLNAAGAAVAVGAFGTVLVSTDGGRQWRSAAPAWAEFAVDGMEPHLYAADLSNDGAITIAGEFGLILRSRNGGKDWQLLHKGDASLFAMDLRPDGVGYAVGQSGAVLRTTDDGATWTDLRSGSGALLLAVHSEASGRVVVTAMRELLLSRDAGDSWQPVNVPEVGNVWYSGVGRAGGVGQAGVDAPVLAVGQAGRIVRIDL
ncbi:MAG: photosystem I reaction center subunit IX [Sinimarinibacterium sp.]|jgi:photosystem II stability/assembly factor-like uncharacterized protein